MKSPDLPSTQAALASVQTVRDAIEEVRQGKTDTVGEVGKRRQRRHRVAELDPADKRCAEPTGQVPLGQTKPSPLHPQRLTNGVREGRSRSPARVLTNS